MAFAEAAKFPEHGLVVLGAQDEKPAPALALFKKIDDAAELEAAVSKVIGICGSAFVETDMRAHRNPTRMTAIGRAASDLVRRNNSLCPVCQWPGYDVTEQIKGLPCSLCGEPTDVIRAEILSCRKCTHREERAVAVRDQADPGQCAQCNPLSFNPHKRSDKSMENQGCAFRAEKYAQSGSYCSPTMYYPSRRYT